jgi:hypothetical protein
LARDLHIKSAMAQRAVRVRVVERGVEGQTQPENGEAPEIVTLRQRATESARDFAQRVSARFAALTHAQVPITGTRVSVSPARGPGAIARRLGLMRAILRQLPDSDPSEVWLEAPRDSSPDGYLDLHALCETLAMQLSGSRTVVRAVA